VIFNGARKINIKKMRVKEPKTGGFNLNNLAITVLK
jgi:hypothetical protein